MTRIGWIGRGEMGAPMVARLEAAGHEVVPLAGRPPRDRARLADGVAGLHVAMTCLPGPAEVTDVWAGPDGLLEVVAAGTVLVDLSTIGPSAAVGLAERADAVGVRAVDCPVSGGPAGAAAGSLSLMPGALDVSYIEEVRPLLEELGTVHPCGGAGSGQAVKLVNQSVLAGMLGGLGLGYALAEASGTDPAFVQRVLSGGVVRGFLLDALWPLMAEDRLEGGFAARHMVKDLGLARELARDHALPEDLLDVVESWLMAAMDVAGPAVATQAIAHGITKGGLR